MNARMIDILDRLVQCRQAVKKSFRSVGRIVSHQVTARCIQWLTMQQIGSGKVKLHELCITKWCTAMLDCNPLDTA